jgi:hypothetical protein
MATTLKFRAHDNHLRNTVLRQAGTLWKAVLEGVMNSVDAGATYCNVTLTSERRWRRHVWGVPYGPWSDYGFWG